VHNNVARAAKAAASEGRNIAEALRSHFGTAKNTPEIIEAAYELQAGTYVAFANDNRSHVETYAVQLAGMLDRHLHDGDIVLDVGSGELTNLSFMVRALRARLARIYACDISESRLALGRAFAGQHMGPAYAALETFRAEMGALPLPDNSVDIVTSNHALEPNWGRESEILSELLRVARRKLVLFEPCYEIASDAARRRMEHHAYIRGLEKTAITLGVTVESAIPLEHVDNHLNPTVCFVITPPPPL
jgi:SAM-dependent methyltransferase